MTNDLISREALMQFPIRRDHYDRENGSEEFISGIETVLEYAESLPAIDVVPVVHGRWIEAKGAIRCSECMNEPLYDYNGRLKLSKACPTCGAKMWKEK